MSRVPPQAALSPNFVAVIGASDQPAKLPIRLLKQQGFAGAIYPINPRTGPGPGVAELPSHCRDPDQD